MQLPLPYRAPGSVNAYLLELADGFCLVDCGTSLDPGWEALRRALAQAGTEPAAVRLLVCTHLHADHAGLAATVAARTACEVLCGLGPDTIDDALRDPKVPLEDRRRAGLREGVAEPEIDLWVDTHLADDVRHERVVPTRYLVAGDVLRSRSGSWRVAGARGHSPTQIVLLHERRRWLISADLAYTIHEPFLEYGWTLDPYAEHLASLDRVLALEPALLLPGHGPPDRDATGRLVEARDAAVALRTRVRATLDHRWRSAHDVVLALLAGDRDTNRAQSLMSTGLCVLEHLELRGELEAAIAEDGVRRFRAVA